MKKYDKEYSTQYTPEKEFLKKRNIHPTFIKVVDEVTTYKYKKTKELFAALIEFYSNN